MTSTKKKDEDEEVLAGGGETKTGTLMHSKTVKANETAVRSVVVFRNGRAEITREMRIKLLRGTNSIKLEGLSSQIEGNSVRVEGKGECVLRSVSYERNYQKSSTTEPQGLAELKKKIEDMQKQVKLQEQHLDRVKSPRCAGTTVCNERRVAHVQHAIDLRHQKCTSSSMGILRRRSSKKYGKIPRLCRKKYGGKRSTYKRH